MIFTVFVTEKIFIKNNTLKRKLRNLEGSLSHPIPKDCDAYSSHPPSCYSTVFGTVFVTWPPCVISTLRVGMATHSDKLLLKKVLRGILHYQGQTCILCQPVTPGVLLAIRPILRRWLGDRDFAMIWAAFTLASFAFLRCSEFTCSGIRKYGPEFDLSATCVSFEPNLACPQRMSIFLKSSKTDTFRSGHTLVIACSPLPLCAVVAMQRYFLLARPRGPLFSFQSGRLLTRKSVVSLLRDAALQASLPHNSLRGHSFRIGAASTAAATGLPDWLIKVLGWWSSDCYQLYIRTPQNVLLSAMPCMANVFLC